MDFRRAIPLRRVIGLTRSSKSAEFIVHIKDEYDFRFSYASREDFFDCIKQMYYLKSGKNLPVYTVDTVDCMKQ